MNSDQSAVLTGAVVGAMELHCGFRLPSRLLISTSVIACASLMGCSDGEAHVAPATPPSIVAYPELLEVRADKTSTVEAKIVLRNEGPDAAQLLTLTATCGCTSPRLTGTRRLEPGESTEIAVDVGLMSYGSRDATVIVTTDLTAQPEVRIPVRIKGPPLVPPYVRKSPAELAHRITSASPASSLPFAVICIEKRDGEPWFLGCECAVDFVTFSKPEVVKEEVLDDGAVRREYEVMASIANGAIQDEKVDVRVMLQTSSESMRPVPTFLLRLLNVPAVRCIPAAIVAESAEAVHTVVVRSEDSVPFQIRSVECGDAGVSVDFDPELMGDAHVLHVRTGKTAPVGDSCVVAVTTSHSDSEQASFTVVWRQSASERSTP